MNGLRRACAVSAFLAIVPPAMAQSVPPIGLLDYNAATTARLVRIESIKAALAKCPGCPNAPFSRRA